MLAQQFNGFAGEEHNTFHLEGGKAAALLVHGFPGTPKEMRPLGDALHAAGWTVHAPLLPGFGADFETVMERTNDDWVNAVHDALITLKRDHSSVVLVGHSMGGALAIQVSARTAPDALILSAPFWKVDHIAWKALPLIRVFFPQPRLFRYLRLDFSKPDVREGIHNFLPDADLDDPEVQQAIRDFRVPVKMFAQIHRAGHRAYAAAPNVNVPTLVLQGAQDELVKPALTSQVIDRLAGNIRYHEVDAEHDLLSDELPCWESVRDNVLRFVQQFETMGV